MMIGRAALLEIFKSDLEAGLEAFHNHTLLSKTYNVALSLRRESC